MSTTVKYESEKGILTQVIIKDGKYDVLPFRTPDKNLRGNTDGEFQVLFVSHSDGTCIQVLGADTHIDVPAQGILPNVNKPEPLFNIPSLVVKHY